MNGVHDNSSEAKLDNSLEQIGLASDRSFYNLPSST